MVEVWKVLYATVWIAFFQFVVIIIPRFTVRLVDIHVLLGLIILGLAHYDCMLMRKTTGVPDRLRRIAKVTAILATIQPVLGLVLFAGLRLGVHVPFDEAIGFVHLVIALAIITQASSLATAFDMWHEHEFTSKP